MITITGTFNQAIIYTDAIDSGAEGLLRAYCNSPTSEGSTIRVMPDVHAGKGCAVGTTITVTDKIAPGFVGADIGCGMTALKVSGKKLEMQKLDKLIHEMVPAGMTVRSKCHRFADKAELDKLLCLRHIQKDKALLSIGTLGSGNHFIELDQDQSGGKWLIVHSGSRRLGAEVSGHYQNEAYRQSSDGTPFELACVTGSLRDEYLHDLGVVQRFAELNRSAIADEIVKGMKLDVEDIFSTVHNYIDRDAMVLRKGAVSARAGERLIIPMNMRDGCLFCIGKGNPEWNCSAPHGAGRLMSRVDSMRSFTLSQFKKEMKGIYSSTISRETLDESPMAYKPMESIVSQLADTVDIVEHTTPLYNFKAGREI